jgi:IS30 family transposase
MSRREHLTEFERERIRALSARGLSRGDIAQAVGRCPQTIYRVLRRNRCRLVWQENNVLSTRSEAEVVSAIRLVRQISSPADRTEGEMPNDLNRSYGDSVSKGEAI